MIETFRTASGEPAFSFQGRLLCSKIAPVKEAASFVTKFVSQIEQSNTIFVLGMAGGHLIDAIHIAYPLKKIIVIETEAEIINAVSCCFTFSLMNVEILNLKDLSQIKNNHYVIAGLNSSYCVLSQPCTQWLSNEFYQSAATLLLGREADAFAFLLTNREDVREALRPLVEIKGLASIKTLTQNLAPITNGDTSKVKLMIKTLRELVV